MAKQHALVVDDDKFYGRTVTELLTQWGYDIVHADDAEQAVERVLGKKIHVAILEQHLPGEWNGSRLATVLLRKSAGVVGMSRSRRDEIDFTAAGVAYFLQKPFRPAQLLAAVKLAVARPVGM